LNSFSIEIFLEQFLLREAGKLFSISDKSEFLFKFYEKVKKENLEEYSFEELMNLIGEKLYLDEKYEEKYRINFNKYSDNLSKFINKFVKLEESKVIELKKVNLYELFNIIENIEKCIKD
jgi:hypothetical protein